MWHSRQLIPDGACRELKREDEAAKHVLAEFTTAALHKLPAKQSHNLQAVISYFENNLGRMNFASYRKNYLPIGCGMTEAACKSVIKTRMSGAGMKWKQSGANVARANQALSSVPSPALLL